MLVTGVTGTAWAGGGTGGTKTGVGGAPAGVDAAAGAWLAEAAGVSLGADHWGGVAPVGSLGLVIGVVSYS
jgi:hypothetical protein